MKIELEYNARSLPAADVARSFVLPSSHFQKLLARNHTLLLGPRGSGKTTLLKMLTAKALENWNHVQAPILAPQVTYNAAFIPADIAWGKQLIAAEQLDFNPHKKEAAFVLHALRSLVRAMREAKEIAHSQVAHVSHLGISIDAAKESEFVDFAAQSLSAKPPLRSLLGLELSLENLLNRISSGSPDLGQYLVESLPSKITLLISAFNGIAGDDSRRWALLFDELEIAPTAIKTFLLSSIRSFDERVIVKLALAPYMDDVGFTNSPTSPQPLHDYHTVQLTYHNKEDAAQFTAELFKATFKRVGIDATDLESVFENAVGGTQFGRRSKSQKQRKGLPQQFHQLAAKDTSFKAYLEEKSLLSKSYKFVERNNAQDIRKLLAIVIAREYFLRKFEGDHAVAGRSRKSYALYAGYPSILEITEGNPRAILTCVGPLALEYEELQRSAESYYPISRALQTKAMRRVELLLTSLLQVIPLDLPGVNSGKGLLGFVDKIGRAFEDRLLKRPFSTDYVGTFFIDENVEPAIIGAIGRALNAGAIIHVPHPESGPDALLRGFVGQRFRLSYSLAPRYRLLLTLGDRISLSKLLQEMTGLQVGDPQASLFDSDVTND